MRVTDNNSPKINKKNSCIQGFAVTSPKSSTLFLVASPTYPDNFMNISSCIFKFLPDRNELEQIERLHSEETRRRLLIIHINESYWIPSQKKTKSK